MENICHRFECEVAFSDTDASGWVHFTRILIYAEKAEHDYLRKIGIGVFARDTGGWPRVRVSCDYKCPLLFQDSIEVRLALGKVGVCSVTWEFEIAKADGQIAAIGQMVAVNVNCAGKAEKFSEAVRMILEGGK